MKKTKRYGLAAASVAAMATAASAHAQAPQDLYANCYYGAEGGVAFAQNTSIIDNTGFGGAGTTIKFDAGWRAGGYAGYRVCRYFSAQLDSGVIWNNITTVGNNLAAEGASAHLEQIPVMWEGYFTYPVGRFKPFLLAGAGADFGTFDSSGIPGSGGGPATVPHYRASDTTFAYEVGFGFTYALTEHLEIGADYKLLGTTDHSWTANNINLKTDGTMVHTLEATLSWRF